VLQSFAGGRLVAERYGAETPVLLALHGWGHDRSDFAPLFARLGLPALALDLPGFGLSPAPDTVYSLADYAALLGEHVVPALAPGAVLIGHSFGGRVAVHLAAREPERFSGLVVTGAPLFRPSSGARPAPAYRLVRRLVRAHLLPPAALEAARVRYGSADYVRAQGVVRDILVRVLAESDEAAMAAVRCPVALVWGAADTAAPLAVAERAASCFAQGSLRVLDGFDHWQPLRNPEAIAEAVTGLVAARHRAGAP
jgi:pimeloyl-ACP methyl ester carboxylesterase